MQDPNLHIYLITYVGIAVTFFGVLLGFFTWKITRKDTMRQADKENTNKIVVDSELRSITHIDEVESRLKERLNEVDDSLKSMDRRARALEQQQMTKDEVKNLLTDRVKPLEDNIRSLEREVRENNKEVHRELKDTTESITKEVKNTETHLLDTMHKISNSLALLKGQLSSRLQDRRGDD